MRALLIVNPHATSTTRLRRDVIVRALSSAVEDLEVVETRYRGHATSLAAAARDDGFGLVLTLGGDGTVNEAVNGILAGGAACRSSGAPSEYSRGTSGSPCRSQKFSGPEPSSDVY